MSQNLARNESGLSERILSAPDAKWRCRLRNSESLVGPEETFSFIWRAIAKIDV